MTNSEYLSTRGFRVARTEVSGCARRVWWTRPGWAFAYLQGRLTAMLKRGEAPPEEPPLPEKVYVSHARNG